MAQDGAGRGVGVGEARNGERTGGFSLPGSKESEPIQIDAEVLEFDAHDNVAVFRGDVVTTQGDTVMRSQVLRVTFAPSDGALGSLENPQAVVAEGDVRITQGGRVARGNRAEFSEVERTLILTGDARLSEGSNEVRGERVVVYLDEERSVVEGTNTRVKAILVPEAVRPDAGPPGPDTADEPAPPPGSAPPAARKPAAEAARLDQPPAVDLPGDGTRDESNPAGDD